MTRVLTLIGAALIAVWPLAATPQTPPAEVQSRLAAPQLQGATTARAWGLRLYDAELWTEKVGAFSFGRKFALTLTYGTRFSAETLARSSVSEIARVEGVSETDHAELERKLAACLVDVRKGLRVTGVAESASRVSLYVNGGKRCTLSYPRLTERFFGIWLAPTSRDAAGAARLRGGA